nr:NAD(P)H-hydrate dehydratase [Shimia biformata]
MRAIEKAAIDSGEVTGLELMERAGRGVVEAVFEEWPELAKTSHRAVVLCGPGNNGGDGFVVARLLKEWGWEVEVFLYGDAEKLPPDAKVNYERWGEMGEVKPLAVDQLVRSEANVSGAEILVVDALFGTGLVRRLNDEICHIMSIAAATDSFAFSKWVFVDMPSGVCADSGRGLRAFDPPLPECAITVTFHRQKLGHQLADGPSECRLVVVKDIGLNSSPGASAPVRPRPAPQGGGEIAPTPGPGANLGVTSTSDPILAVDAPDDSVFKNGDHKYSHGHALILSGGAGKTGAARLAARGALRIGAGLVTLGVPHEAQAEVAAQITALMMCEVGDPGALSHVLQDDRINALCLGPGMGLEPARDLVPVALQQKRATVLDADALTGFADAPEVLFDMLHEDCVLTPHEGEFKRLFPDIHARLIAPATTGPAYSKVDATREAAARAGCTVLFKGPDTVIADLTGACSINSAHYDRAAPWLATAGAGDVLAGFIAGLLARGFVPMQAAEIAAWLHVECARTFGPGLIAEDLPEILPRVLQELAT